MTNVQRPADMGIGTAEAVGRLKPTVTAAGVAQLVKTAVEDNVAMGQ